MVGKERLARPVSKPRVLVKEVESVLVQTSELSPRTRPAKMALSNSTNRTLRSASVVFAR